MNNKEEALCKFVEYNDLENIEKLLEQGMYYNKVVGTKAKLDFYLRRA